MNCEKTSRSGKEWFEYAENCFNGYRKNRAQLFKRAEEEFKTEGEIEWAASMQLEYLLFSASLHGKTSDPDRFMALKEWTEEDLTYFEQRAKDTINPIHRAIYFEILWDQRQHFTYGEGVIDAYLDCVSLYIQNKWDYELSDALIQARKIAMQLNNKEKMKIVKERHFWALEQLVSTERYRYCIEIVESLLELSTKYEIKNLEYLNEILEQGRKYFHKNVTDSYPIQQDFLRLKRNVFHLLGDESGVNKTKLEIAQSYEEEGDWKRVNYSSGNLVAAPFYKQSEPMYRELGMIEKADELRLKRRECIEIGEKTELPAIGTSFTIKNAEIDKYLEKWRDLPNDKILGSLSRDHKWIPKLQTAKELVERTKGQFVASTIFDTSTIDRGKVVDQTTEIKDRLDGQIVRIIQLSYTKNSTWLGIIFDQLQSKRKLCSMDLLTHLNNSGMIDPEQFEIVSTGVQRYFSQDYISAIHLLTPQLEAIFRRIVENLGKPAFRSIRGVMMEIPLNKLFKISELTDILGEDLHFFLWTFLVDQRGMNLRNRVAHGLIDTKTCTKQNCILLIYIYLVLGAIFSKIQAKNAH